MGFSHFALREAKSEQSPRSRSFIALATLTFADASVKRTLHSLHVWRGCGDGGAPSQ